MQFELPLTARDYGPNLRYLRQAIATDRRSTQSRLRISNASGASLELFIRHSDLYVTGLNFGRGDYYFLGEVVPKGARPLEFAGSYFELGLSAATGPQTRPVWLEAANLDQAVFDLSRHQPTAQGSNFFARDKYALIRLLFAIPEALRFWSIENAVTKMLLAPGTRVNINDYAGSGKPLNSWESWSRRPDWPMTGIMVPHPCCTHV